MTCIVLLICYNLCRYVVLGSTDSTNIGNIGEVQWRLAVCLLLGWILVYVCIIKGVKSSGKVSCCKHHRSNKTIFRPRRLHVVHKLWPYITDVVRSVVCVCLSVSACVAHTG